MSNLLLTFRHGNGNAVNVREAPGRALKNGEIVHQPDTGQVLICTDHDVEADSDEWAGAYPDAGTVWEAVNPNYVADSATVVARRGAAVYAELNDTGSAFDADTNPYDTIVFANGLTTIFLGTIDGKDLVEGNSVFLIRFTDKLPTAIAAAAT
ncbi:MAG: hypothetical protein RIK87_08455 [Fuerstiella sp.]